MAIDYAEVLGVLSILGFTPFVLLVLYFYFYIKKDKTTVAGTA